MINPFKSDERASKKALEEEIQAYRRLETLSVQNEFKEYSDRLMKTVAHKMIWAFTNDSIKSWEDFCKVRGEIHARLQPLQEVHEAGALANYMQQQLEEQYGNKNAIDNQ